jgi:hypothetical protein
MATRAIVAAAIVLVVAGCQALEQPKPATTMDAPVATSRPAPEDSPDIYTTRAPDSFTAEVEGTPSELPPHVDLFKPGEVPTLLLKNLGGKTVLITLEKVGENDPRLSSSEVYIPQPWNRRCFNWGPLKNGSYNVTVSTRNNFSQSVGFYVGDEKDSTRLPLSTSPSASSALNPH